MSALLAITPDNSASATAPVVIVEVVMCQDFWPEVAGPVVVGFRIFGLADYADVFFVDRSRVMPVLTYRGVFGCVATATSMAPSWRFRRSVTLH